MIIIVINSVVKIYLQVKNENKTPLIPVFQVIFKFQNSEIFVQKYSNNIWLWKLPRIEYEYQYLEEIIQIFKYIRIFVYSLMQLPPSPLLKTKVSNHKGAGKSRAFTLQPGVGSWWQQRKLKKLFLIFKTPKLGSGVCD